MAWAWMKAVIAARMKGAVSELKAFAVTVETVDGERGEYCSVHSGKSGAMVGQVRALAPHVLGMDAEAREAVYNKLEAAASPLHGDWAFCD